MWDSCVFPALSSGCFEDAKRSVNRLRLEFCGGFAKIKNIIMNAEYFQKDFNNS